MENTLNLYLIEQSENCGYDTYDSCVVVAKDEDLARLINPDYLEWGNQFSAWCSSPDKVTVTYLGIADSSLEDGEIVCSSFNAG